MNTKAAPILLFIAIAVVAASMAYGGDVGRYRRYATDTTSDPTLTIPLLENLNIRNQGGNTGDTVTLTRTTAATYMDGGVIKTAAVNAARFGYPNLTSTTKAGLLVESAQTNLLLRSEHLSDVKWRKGGVAVTANQAATPIFGNATGADLIVPSALGGEVYQVYSSASGLGATSYVFSIHAKAKTENVKVTLGIRKGFGNNTSTRYYTNMTAIIPSANWKRAYVFGSFTGTYTTVKCRVAFTHSTSLDIYAVAAQLEKQTTSSNQIHTPSSYIPTIAATSSRTTDVASFTRPATYNPAGTIVLDFMPRYGSGYLFTAAGILTSGSSATRDLYQGSGSPVINRRLISFDGTNSILYNTFNTPLVNYRIGHTWDAQRRLMRNYISGAQVASGTYDGEWLPATTINILSSNNGFIKNIRYWDYMLTDEEMKVVQ